MNEDIDETEDRLEDIRIALANVVGHHHDTAGDFETIDYNLTRSEKREVYRAMEWEIPEWLDEKHDELANSLSVGSSQKMADHLPSEPRVYILKALPQQDDRCRVVLYNELKSPVIARFGTPGKPADKDMENGVIIPAGQGWESASHRLPGTALWVRAQEHCTPVLVSQADGVYKVQVQPSEDVTEGGKYHLRRIFGEDPERTAWEIVNDCTGMDVEWVIGDPPHQVEAFEAVPLEPWNTWTENDLHENQTQPVWIRTEQPVSLNTKQGATWIHVKVIPETDHDRERREMLTRLDRTALANEDLTGYELKLLHELERDSLVIRQSTLGGVMWVVA